MTSTSNETPDYVREVLEERASVKLVPLCIRGPIHDDPMSPVLICVQRDELVRLPDFLRHYRTCGIERFVFIDNGSTDGSREYLSRQADVDLFDQTGRFNWKLKQGWINRIIDLYGRNRWYMYADADEHIVFDESKVRTFRELVSLVSKMGLCRVRGFLIDMYSSGPILSFRHESGARLADSYPLFDLDVPPENKFIEVMSMKGGPRSRVFGVGVKQFRPELTKYPIFTLREGDFMCNPHHIWPYDLNFASPRILGILHYKFMPDFVSRVKKAVEAKTYWDDSFEYRCYDEGLRDNPALAFEYDRSGRYSCPQSLLDAGLIERIDWPSPSSTSTIRMLAAARRHSASLMH